MENEKPGNRDSAGRFMKGQSGNPNGRKKVPEEFREIAELNSPKALLVAVEIMENVKKEPRDRLKAAEIIMAYGVGKPIQHVVADNTTHINVQSMEELVAEIKDNIKNIM